MKRFPIVLVLGALLLLPGVLRTQEAKEEDLPKELHKMVEEVFTAVEQGNFNALLPHLDKDVVVTWLDGRVSKGPQEVRDYLDSITWGPGHMVDSHRPTVAWLNGRTPLSGNTVVAYGGSSAIFRPTGGWSDCDLTAHWSATVVKDGERWKIASFHASANVFDNGVMASYLRWRSYLVGGVAGLGGLVLGGLLAALFLRRRQARA
jgi:hypothetical protein